MINSDPRLLAVLDEMDSLIAQLKEVLNSNSETECSVSLIQALEKTEQLRIKITCMSYPKETDWVETLQVVVCIAQFVAKLWGN